jgi:hypothetical protein
MFMSGAKINIRIWFLEVARGKKFSGIERPHQNTASDQLAPHPQLPLQADHL